MNPSSGLSQNPEWVGVFKTAESDLKQLLKRFRPPSAAIWTGGVGRTIRREIVSKRTVIEAIRSAIV